MSDQPVLDSRVPHSARRYNYWLGGKDNFASDRNSGELVAQAFPTVRAAARQNRAFLHRVVAFLAGQGLHQFLDVGSGLPSAQNTHEVAQRINPSARVVYVDNDPLVAVHGRALLHPAAGTTAIVEADVRDPSTILSDQGLRDILDLTEPVGLLLIAVLHFLDDSDQPHAIVQDLLDALPAGSWLGISHASADLLETSVADNSDTIIAKSAIPMTLRSRERVKVFFDGLDLAEPGLVPVQRWRPTESAEDLPADSDIGIYGGLARKSC